ncbi:MAG: hypothetical protein K8I03_01190 [Ignavibacteria bacterium]|nr:hypothetical protein [Ignavibacteria bacterium]
MNNDQNKTSYVQNNSFAQNSFPPVRKKSALPIWLGGGAFVVIVAGLLYYFLVFNADPKIKIEYSVNGGIEQKNATTYEQLYKSASNIRINVILDKAPRRVYSISVNGNKQVLEFSKERDLYKAAYEVKTDAIQNSYYTVELASDNPKILFTDNFNVIILKPNISSREYIDNYLKTYSAAVSNRNPNELQNASAFWLSSMSGNIYDKMRKNFSELSYVWYENVMSTPDDDVRAKVYFTYLKKDKWTYVTSGYLYNLEVVKGPSGLPEWKIKQAKETIEKRESQDYSDFEGGC